jgi:hypothetical protein
VNAEVPFQQTDETGGHVMKTQVKPRSAKAEYFCLFVRRHYEEVWRAVSKHDSREAAERELENRRSFTGPFNYDNADLRVLSRTEARKEFGKGWDFKPIGNPRKVTKSIDDID